ncbi:sorting nexin-7 isoform X4 [Poecilia latipinna]|uniref:sorting nexin-7 isoform X4 n=1 Tax=Poecilia latipinna TaxID=48699 RepID=UPI00072E1091|nr:PREDICTED: sorting nexin-7 isoform X4 [Poecilia latipinna]
MGAWVCRCQGGRNGFKLLKCLIIEGESVPYLFRKNTSLADGNPMPNSPDSMVNQFRLDEENEEEQQGAINKDIFVTVDNPESHISAIETFITYRVVTRTTCSEFDSSEYEVRRRYQDFLWLKSRLEENYPTLIIHELAPHRKLGPGFLSRMSETMRAMANSVRGLRSKLEEFAVMQEYVDDFSNKMCSVDKVTNRIIKEHREYMDELKQYGPTYFQWAESEELLAEPLKGVGSCVERCSKETEEQIQHLSEVLVPTLHEYVLCADTLKAVMRRRDNIQAEFEAKNEALASRTTDKEMLQEEVDDLADRVEQANNALRGDWSRWRTSMRADLKSAFISTAAKNVDYYEKCLAVWESFLLSQRGESMEQRNGADAS